MNIARNLVLALCLVGLVACGGNKAAPPPPAIAQLAVITQPLSGDFSAPLSLQVQFQDASGNVVPASLPVGISLVTSPANPVLTGTTLVDAVAGTATFDDLYLDASGTFQVVARGGSAPFEVTSAPFSYGGPPYQLGFTGPIGPTSVFAPTPFSVEVQDKNGNPIPGAESVVLISVVKNPSSLLLRAVHSALPSVFLEWLEPLTPAFMQTLNLPIATDRTFTDMIYHTLSNRVYSVDGASGPSAVMPFRLYSTDPFTGDTFLVGDLDPGAIGLRPRAITEDSIGLLAGDNSANVLYDVDPVTGQATPVGFPVSVPGITVYEWLSMTTHPLTGENYGVCLTSASFGPQDRSLIRFDGATLQGTYIGQLPMGTSSISFFPDGKLFSTQGGTFGKAVFIIDPSTGASLGGVGIGDPGIRGAAIATVPGPYFGTLNLTTTGGVANFTDLVFLASGDGFQLQATAPNLQPALSNTFTVNP